MIFFNQVIFSCFVMQIQEGTNHGVGARVFIREIQGTAGSWLATSLWGHWKRGVPQTRTTDFWPHQTKRRGLYLCVIRVIKQTWPISRDPVVEPCMDKYPIYFSNRSLRFLLSSMKYLSLIHWKVWHQKDDRKYNNVKFWVRSQWLVLMVIVLTIWVEPIFRVKRRHWR